LPFSGFEPWTVKPLAVTKDRQNSESNTRFGKEFCSHRQTKGGKALTELGCSQWPIIFTNPQHVWLLIV